MLWLTTIRRNGTPVSRPVWFVWDDPSIVVYTQPAARKVVQLVRSPLASVHLEAGPEGDDVVVLDVRADIVPGAAPPSSLPAYASKYAERIVDLGMTSAQYDAAFTTAIRLEVLRQVEVLDELPLG